MMTENDILMEIVHIASQALVADLTDVKRQALADIYDAIAGLLPVERLARGASPTVDHAADGRACRPATAEPELQGYDKFLTVAPGVQLVRFAGKDTIVLMARRKGRSGNPNTLFSICVDKESRTAFVNRDDRELFTIASTTCDYSMVERCAISALHRWFKNQRPCKAKRRRAARLRAEQKEAQQ